MVARASYKTWPRLVARVVMVDVVGRHDGRNPEGIYDGHLRAFFEPFVQGEGFLHILIYDGICHYTQCGLRREGASDARDEQAELHRERAARIKRARTDSGFAAGGS